MARGRGGSHRTQLEAHPRSQNGTSASKRERFQRQQPQQQQSQASSSPATRPSLSPKLQQQCLDIFRSALKPEEESQSVLQEVKGHLFNRDFAAAFGRDEYLRVYASRWSPSRALAYAQVTHDIEHHVAVASKTTRVVCVGGGAGGELVGLAAWHSQRSNHDSNATAPARLDVNLVDIADWSNITNALASGIQTPPEVSKYASQAKKDANKALLDGNMLSVNFYHQDALNLGSEQKDTFVQNLASANLVTFMFTLNELYSTSLASTQALLAILTESMKPGAILLIVDSPGSYSTVSINGAEKRYPMQWLLDHTLLGEGATWEKIESDESRWFRLSPALEYPIGLEDMRYQIHLYRRLE